jgi:hypothetical protein
MRRLVSRGFTATRDNSAMKRLIARAGLLTLYPLRVIEHATRGSR